MASLCRRTIFALNKKTAKAEQLLALAVERVTFLAAKDQTTSPPLTLGHERLWWQGVVIRLNFEPCEEHWLLGDGQDARCCSVRAPAVETSGCLRCSSRCRGA